MVTLDTFLANVNKIASESPTYRTGGSGKDGTCDCVGLIMGAMYRAGHSSYALHSSNYFARWQMQSLQTVSSASALRLGDIVYKRRQAEINARYLSGGKFYNGDTQDYYHVGVVTSVSPLRITHCTSGNGVDGITNDFTLGKWSCAGRLVDVYYDEGGNTDMAALYDAKVIADSGSTVNMRKAALATASVLTTVPIGSLVQVLSVTTTGWSEIYYEGQQGYMMSKFLQKIEGAEIEDNIGITDDTGAAKGVWIPCPDESTCQAVYEALRSCYMK